VLLAVPLAIAEYFAGTVAVLAVDLLESPVDFGGGRTEIQPAAVLRSSPGG